jgi:hypothetical protein
MNKPTLENQPQESYDGWEEITLLENDPSKSLFSLFNKTLYQYLDKKKYGDNKLPIRIDIINHSRVILSEGEDLSLRDVISLAHKNHNANGVAVQHLANAQFRINLEQKSGIVRMDTKIYKQMEVFVSESESSPLTSLDDNGRFILTEEFTPDYGTEQEAGFNPYSMAFRNALLEIANNTGSFGNLDITPILENEKSKFITADGEEIPITDVDLRFAILIPGDSIEYVGGGKKDKGYLIIREKSTVSKSEQEDIEVDTDSEGEELLSNDESVVLKSVRFLEAKSNESKNHFIVSGISPAGVKLTSMDAKGLMNECLAFSGTKFKIDNGDVSVLIMVESKDGPNEAVDGLDISDDRARKFFLKDGDEIIYNKATKTLSIFPEVIDDQKGQPDERSDGDDTDENPDESLDQRKLEQDTSMLRDLLYWCTDTDGHTDYFEVSQLILEDDGYPMEDRRYWEVIDSCLEFEGLKRNQVSIKVGAITSVVYEDIEKIVDISSPRYNLRRGDQMTFNKSNNTLFINLSGLNPEEAGSKEKTLDPNTREKPKKEKRKKKKETPEIDAESEKMVEEILSKLRATREACWEKIGGSYGKISESYSELISRWGKLPPLYKMAIAYTVVGVGGMTGIGWLGATASIGFRLLGFSFIAQAQGEVAEQNIDSWGAELHKVLDGESNNILDNDKYKKLLKSIGINRDPFTMVGGHLTGKNQQYLLSKSKEHFSRLRKRKIIKRILASFAISEAAGFLLSEVGIFKGGLLTPPIKNFLSFIAGNHSDIVDNLPTESVSDAAGAVALADPAADQTLTSEPSAEPSAEPLQETESSANALTGSDSQSGGEETSGPSPETEPSLPSSEPSVEGPPQNNVDQETYKIKQGDNAWKVTKELVETLKEGTLSDADRDLSFSDMWKESYIVSADGEHIPFTDARADLIHEGNVLEIHRDASGEITHFSIEAGESTAPGFGAEASETSSQPVNESSSDVSRQVGGVELDTHEPSYEDVAISESDTPVVEEATPVRTSDSGIAELVGLDESQVRELLLDPTAPFSLDEIYETYYTGGFERAMWDVRNDPVLYSQFKETVNHVMSYAFGYGVVPGVGGHELILEFDGIDIDSANVENPDIFKVLNSEVSSSTSNLSVRTIVNWCAREAGVAPREADLDMSVEDFLTKSVIFDLLLKNN